ncbi:MAG: hypothetical protein RLZ10_2077 [Bacteroidota bacterium]|jgi:hypothetical protein
MNIYLNNTTKLFRLFFIFAETVFINQIYILINVINFIFKKFKNDAIFKNLNFPFTKISDHKVFDREEAVLAMTKGFVYIKTNFLKITIDFFSILNWAFMKLGNYFAKSLSKLSSRQDLYQKTTQIEKPPSDPVINQHENDIQEAKKEVHKTPVVLDKMFRNKKEGQKVSLPIISFLPVTMFFCTFGFQLLFIGVFTGLLVILLLGIFGIFGITALGEKTAIELQKEAMRKEKFGSINSKRQVPVEEKKIMKVDETVPSTDGFLLAKDIKFYVENANGKDRNSKIINGIYFFINDFFDYYLSEYRGNDQGRFKLILEMKNYVLDKGIEELYTSYKIYVNSEDNSVKKIVSLNDVKRILSYLTFRNCDTYITFKQTRAWIDSVGMGGKTFDNKKVEFKIHDYSELDSIAYEISLFLQKIRLD